MDFEPSKRCSEFKERLSAFMDDHVYPAEPVYEQTAARLGRPPSPAGDHGGAEDTGARGGAVEHVPARRRARRRAIEQRLRPARGDPRALADRLGGLQLLGAGHRQHGGPPPVRDAGAEGPLADPPARRRDPLGVRDDRARRGELGRDQRRAEHRARWRGLRAQWPQVVDHERVPPPLPDHDRDGQDAARRADVHTAEPDPRATRHGGGDGRAQPAGVRLHRPGRATGKSCSRTCACRSRT